MEQTLEMLSEARDLAEGLGASDLQLGHIGSATDWLIAASVVTQSEPGGAQNPSEIFLSLGAAASLARAFSRSRSA